MALITVLYGVLYDWLPSLSALFYLFIIGLPTYHLLLVPVHFYFSSKLSKVPGPLITLLTPHYITFLDALGLRTTTLHKWHQQYGSVVRVSPNEVSFTSPIAVKQIYQDPTMEKDTRLYGLFKNFGANNAFTSRTRWEHGWRRKGVAATLSWSKVLETEGADMWIGKVIGRYLRMVEENGLTSAYPPDKEKRHLVDVYLLNNWFATDVVTGFIFGPQRGTKTLCLDTLLDHEIEKKWWQKASYHRRMVKEHYAPKFRAHTYLYVEFPLFMQLVDRLVSWMEAILKKISAFAGTSDDITAWESEVFGRRIGDWGWKTWMAIKNNRRHDASGTCVAEVLAELVDSASYAVKNDKSGSGGTDEARASAWSDEIAASELMDQMLAGMDTTSDTLSFLLYHLSLPSSASVQSSLHSELVEAFPPSAISKQLPPFFFYPDALGLGSLEAPDHYSQSLQSINRLPYLDAVIKETLRLYPAIPGTLPRVVPHNSELGKTIDGLHIAAGTIVGSFAYGIHRDNPTFGSDEFDPSRWIVSGPSHMKAGEANEENDWLENHNHGLKPESNSGPVVGRGLGHRLPSETNTELQVKAMEKRLWAFGSGGRGCVGKHLAMLEMKMLVATIFWRYKTEVVSTTEAQLLGKLRHSHWDHRKTFRDVLPFKGVNGVLAFIPYNDASGAQK